MHMVTGKLLGNQLSHKFFLLWEKSLSLPNGDYLSSDLPYLTFIIFMLAITIWNWITLSFNAEMVKSNQMSTMSIFSVDRHYSALLSICKWNQDKVGGEINFRSALLMKVSISNFQLSKVHCSAWLHHAFVYNFKNQQFLFHTGN